MFGLMKAAAFNLGVKNDNSADFGNIMSSLLQRSA
jgi:hypothetical protein